MLIVDHRDRDLIKALDDAGVVNRRGLPVHSMYSLFLRRRYDVCALTDKDGSIARSSASRLGDDETVHVLAYRPETIVALDLDFLLVERLFEFER